MPKFPKFENVDPTVCRKVAKYVAANRRRLGGVTKALMHGAEKVFFLTDTTAWRYLSYGRMLLLLDATARGR